MKPHNHIGPFYIHIATKGNDVEPISEFVLCFVHRLNWQVQEVLSICYSVCSSVWAFDASPARLPFAAKPSAGGDCAISTPVSAISSQLRDESVIGQHTAL